MRMFDIIAKKRDGGELTDSEIAFFVKGCTSGQIPDYQISALLMAIYLKGMSERETEVLTLEMAKSGEQVDLSVIDGVTVDKHSTGGVGDKTTLIVVPIVAALGGKVVKMSGRGLGHTGGTVDKLESINGFKTELSPEEFIECVNTVGACMIGQSGNLAPADKKLYALRDVTATVSCIPLIASSIMSKKLASGSDCIVLDVKVGSGAFMKTFADAQKLSEQMIRLGNAAGRKVASVITNMDIPLGYAIGNSLEVIEAVKILKGEQKDELYEVCIELAANMLSLTSGKTLPECRQLACFAVENGLAFSKLKEIVAAQDGDVGQIDNTELFPKAKIAHKVISQNSGYISSMNSEMIGSASAFLGAGRTQKGDPIDHSAGIILEKKTGDFVSKGETIATLYTNNQQKVSESESAFFSSLRFSDSKPVKQPIILNEQ